MLFYCEPFTFVGDTSLFLGWNYEKDPTTKKKKQEKRIAQAPGQGFLSRAQVKAPIQPLPAADVKFPPDPAARQKMQPKTCGLSASAWSAAPTIGPPCFGWPAWHFGSAALAPSEMPKLNKHRWPFGKIDGPGKWKKPHLNQCHLLLIKLN